MADEPKDKKDNVIWLDDLTNVLHNTMEVPRAFSIAVHVCPERPISHIHLILKDRDGDMIAQGTADHDMVLGWWNKLNGM
jgi:hypothetical protein